MELVSNEIIYVDINANEEDVLKAVVFETTGSGKISRCVDWFVNSRYKRLMVVATEDEYSKPQNLGRAVYNNILQRGIEDIYSTIKYGKVYLVKVVSANNGN